MYDQFYGFTGRPFQLTPDPAFYFESGTHRKAMSYLGYGLAQGEGFIVITGDIGAGKTTLVGHLMNSIDPGRLTAVKLVSTAVSGDALLQLVAEQFGIDWDGLGKAELLRAIEQFLREQARAGRRTLLIVDEGQNLPVDALEELRMLSNFQLGGHSLLQIFLLGQPEFRHTLFQSPSLEQLRQRVIATHHLDPMEPEEIEPYILHRLGKVGWQGNPTFSPDAFELLFDHSDGVPRRLNVLVSRVLLFGAVEQLARITGAHVRSVVAEMSADGGFAQPAEAAPTPLVVPPPFVLPEPVAKPLMAAPEAPLEWPRPIAASRSDPEIPADVAAPFVPAPETAAPPFASPPVAAAVDVAGAARFASAPSVAAPPFAAAPPAAAYAWPPTAAAPAPFAAPVSGRLSCLAPMADDEALEPLPMPASASFIEARSLVANHFAAALPAPVAAPVEAPFGGAAVPVVPEPVAEPEPAAPPFAAPFAPPVDDWGAAQDGPAAADPEPLEPLELGAPFALQAAPVAGAPEPLALVAPLDTDAMIALQRQIAGLEARLVDQDAALRRVLDLLIDWVERDPAGAPAAREWAA